MHKQKEEKEREMQREVGKLELEHQIRLKELETISKKEPEKERAPANFDLAKNVRLVPKYNEDVETYFCRLRK